MPFTVSHVVAILPLTGPRARRIFVPAALVIGAMVPDVALFAPVISYGWTHAAIGLVSVDLVLGLGVFVLWDLVLRRPLVDLAPAALRARVPPPTVLTPLRLLRAALSVVLGAATHALWDGFTHAGRWGTELIPALAEPTAVGLPGYKLLQFGSGAGGLLILLGWLVWWWRRTPPRSEIGRTGTHAARLSRPVVWSAVAIVTLAVGAFSGAMAVSANRSLEAVAFSTVTRSMAAAAVAVVVVCLCWWAVRSVRRRSNSEE